ncbi:MAG: GAF domain-containing protein [Caldilineaceae bacterium]
MLASIEASLRTMQRLYMENEAIAAINQEITTGDIDSLSRVIATQVARLTEVKYTAVFSYDEGSEELVSQFVWDQAKQVALSRKHRISCPKQDLGVQLANYRGHCGLNDTTSPIHPLLSEILEGDMAAEFCVPLVSQDTLVGVLYMASPSVNDISTEDRSSAQRLAPLAAVALQNAKLLAKQSDDLRLDRAIIRLHNAIADVLLEEEQTEQILSVLQDYMPEGHNLFIATYDEHHRQIRLHVVFENDKRIDALDTHPLYKPRFVGARNGLIDYMLTRQEPMPILDVPDFSVWKDKNKIEDGFSENLRCCLVLELRLPHTDEIIGWIGLRGMQDAHMFGPELRTLLQETAPYLAVVLHNSKEYAQRAREREAVIKFQTEVSSLSETQAAEVEQLSHSITTALDGLRLYTGDLLIALYDAEQTRITAPVVFLDGKSLSAEEKAERSCIP